MTTNNDIFTSKTILITGGTGSWGQCLTERLLQSKPTRIIIFSRGELRQVEMGRKFDTTVLKFIIGDIRDYNAVNNCIKTYKPDYIYHLAALKHVPICEEQPEEAIKTNILGVMHLINACKGSSVKKFVLVSTDKAVDPINTYGMTKGIVERLVINANLRSGTEFLCVRAGNVLGSNGSLIPYIRDCVRNGYPVKVTNLNMTRFFLTLPKAIDLLIFATEQGFGGEIYVMRMPSFTLQTIVKTTLEYYEGGMNNIKVIGAKPGEKLHEVLISNNELSRVSVVNQNYYVIEPEVNLVHPNRLHIWQHEDFKIGIDMKHAYTSADDPQPGSVFLQLLKDGGF